MEKPTDWTKIKFLSKCAAVLVFASMLAECGSNARPSPPPAAHPSEPAR